MTIERKTSLVGATKAAHAFLSISTSWMMCDFAHTGIEISCRDEATGNTLCASLRDMELDGMSDAEVMSWVRASVKDHEGRKKQTRRAVAAERQVDRE